MRFRDLYTLASAVTGLRFAIAATIPLFAPYGLLLPVYLFALFTDVLDGTIARRRGTCTRAGAMFDGWTDKILHVNVAWTLGVRDLMPDTWMFLWFSREFIQLPMFFLLIRAFRLGLAPMPRTNWWGRLTALLLALSLVQVMRGGSLLGVSAWTLTVATGVAGALAALVYGRDYLRAWRA